MKIMEIDEYVFNYNGIKIVAVENPTCKGCFFARDKGRCVAIKEIPPCDAQDRKDHKNVIFVENKETQK